MPAAYWPTRTLPDENFGFAASVWKNGVDEGDLWYVLSLPIYRLDRIRFGARDELDRRYGSRSTIAEAYTRDGHRLEVGLRRDTRFEEEVCLVFHARYL